MSPMEMRMVLGLSHIPWVPAGSLQLVCTRSKALHNHKMATIVAQSSFQELSARLVVAIDSGANCYFLSTKIFNSKNIMSTDVFDLNKACPAILLDTELSTIMDFNFKDLIGIWYALVYCAYTLCVYTVSALAYLDSYRRTCPRLSIA